MQGLRRYHPLLILLFFGGALVLTLWASTPLVTIFSFVSALYYVLRQQKMSGLQLKLRPLFYFLPLIVLMNAFFNDRGMTVLFRLFGRNITLEALLYGLQSGLMLLATLLWFLAMQDVLTGGKLVRLLAKRLPTFGLMTGMVFRYVPEFLSRAEQLEMARFALRGEQAAPSGPGDIIRRINQLFMYSLESSIVTVNVMNAKGYGQGKRSAFSDERWHKRDFALALLLLLVSLLLVTFILSGGGAFLFYPVLYFPPRALEQGCAFWLALVSGLYFALPALLTRLQTHRDRRLTTLKTVPDGIVLREVRRGKLQS